MMKFNEEVAVLANIVGEVEKIIDADKNNESLMFNKQHTDNMMVALRELLKYRDLTVPVSKKFEEKYRYQLRYLSESLYIVGLYPKIEN